MPLLSSSTPVAEIHASGLKVTTPRVKVLRVFQEGERRHWSAEDVYQALLAQGADIGLATVYRVLMQFVQAGLLTRTHFETGKAVFELNHGHHHDHLVCVRCGHVEEFCDAEIEARQETIAGEKGFHLQGHALALYGWCAGCR
jgi:Fur family transcriptional regulator, ferric uptake regulator